MTFLISHLSFRPGLIFRNYSFLITWRLGLNRTSQIVLVHVRDDTHTTSTNIVQFSRPPTPLFIYVQNSSTPLTLDVQFQTNPPPFFSK